MKERNGFIFYRSFLDTIEQCEEKDQLALYRGIVYYALNRNEPTFDNPLLKLVWTLTKPILDKGWTGFDNGCNGGAPVGNSNARKTTKKQTKNNQESTQEQPKNNQHHHRYKMYDERCKMNDETNISLSEKEDTEENESHSSEYSSFLKWLNQNCTHLLKMNIPTEEEYQKLMEAADQNKKTLTDKLLAMENNKDVPKTKRSIYRTCLEWLKRDKK